MRAGEIALPQAFQRNDVECFAVVTNLIAVLREEFVEFARARGVDENPD